MLCVLSGTTLLALVASSFSLSWTHSVEKTLWQETWRVAGEKLEIVEARVEGAGAGIELPENAELVDGGWRYRPDLPPLASLTLAASGATPSGWSLCTQNGCTELGAEAGTPTVVWAETGAACTGAFSGKVDTTFPVRKRDKTTTWSPFVASAKR